MQKIPLAALALTLTLVPAFAGVFDSTGSGNWNAATTTTWNPAGNPQTGSTDDVNILTGHTVLYTGDTVGLPGSGDLGVAGGHSININGGTLSQTPTGNWVRIGQTTTGTVNINDGAFNFTNTVGTGQGPNLQVGMFGGTGIINIGDGTGAAGSAKLDLRHTAGGTVDNGIAVNMNLGSGADAAGGVGRMVIKSDGVLEGDVRTDTGASNPVIRVGQQATPGSPQSSITIQAGGRFNAHGTVEIGSNAASGADRSNGLISISGAGARMDQDGGELNVGWNGDGALVIDNGGVYSKTNNAGNRLDVIVGREAAGVGNVTIQNGGQFLLGAGGDVADTRIGLSGKGTLTINDGGLYQRDAGNWDWIGQNSGGNGTLTVNTGGTFRTTAGSNFMVGVGAGATGLVEIKGGTLDLQSTTGGAGVNLAQNGNGTFRQTAGVTNAQSFILSENDGISTFDLQGGTVTTRAQFFMGGAGVDSAGAGTATGTQSGGTLNVNGAFVVGIAANHKASYTLTGGAINHAGSDISIGESGIGAVTIGAGTSLNDNSPDGTLYVGRNDGSQGTLLVNGTLTRVSTALLRVGNGNSGGVDNSTATGVLGGTGSIVTTAAGVRIGAKGTLTGGTKDNVGALSITGAVAFSAGGTLYANIDAAGGADKISITGTVDITGAVLDGQWAAGAPIGTGSRYWLITNDGTDAITGTFANAVSTSAFSGLYPGAGGYVTFGGQEFALFYGADSATNALTGGNDLLLSAVPEPGSTLLLGAVSLLGLARRRRVA
ncbi:MAG: PEP-CTERM sorting domain-containing protein [Verrucomicrobiota bacterium]